MANQLFSLLQETLDEVRTFALEFDSTAHFFRAAAEVRIPIFPHCLRENHDQRLLYPWKEAKALKDDTCCAEICHRGEPFVFFALL
jgi:hypothetical protein